MIGGYGKTMNKLLEAYPVFEEINKDVLKIISEKGYYKEINANEYIKENDENCIGMIFVIRGSVNIQRLNEDGDATNLFNIGKREICHEALSCILKCQSLNTVGRAIQDSELFVIPSNIVRKYLLEDKVFLQYIYKDIYKKLKIIIDKKEEIIHESVEKRLIKLLVSKNNKIIYSTHKELALEIGTSREVISRKLKEIEKRGYIEISRGKIKVIKDLNTINVK